MLHEQLNLEILPNGNLRITATKSTLDEALSLRDASHWGDFDILWEMTERYWTNGSFTPFDAGQGNPFVGLTEAPCIAESMDILDDGSKEIVGRFWYYGAYMVRSWLDDLYEHGEATFTLFH